MMNLLFAVDKHRCLSVFELKVLSDRHVRVISTFGFNRTMKMGVEIVKRERPQEHGQMI